ncbi:MAG: VTT domain-containing protein [Armatimonadota bacterium]|nr:VTT domain-containing protein [Armatimonadota bacterium]MDR7448220.1 VTT domain-containing protein [Armatimonadota bacterium]MDR7458849.1 VTT domain-containing protein [Armatimonadota bacterium]MDR7479135.1 VTT domain-containing protein [Armatimonadota bacterium]MDR7487653.1 VTT domain-containing protein [Armatimonadota bacterium]
MTVVEGYGAWGVLAAFALESAFVPFPTEAAFLVAIRLPHPVAFLAVLGGQLLGSVAAYLVGRQGGWLLRRAFSGRPGAAAVQRPLRDLFVRHGAVAILVVRFLGQLRPWGSCLAGVGLMPFPTFLLWTLIGSLLYTVAGLALFAYLASRWAQWGWLPRATLVLLAVAGVVGWVVHLVRQHRAALAAHGP